MPLIGGTAEEGGCFILQSADCEYACVRLHVQVWQFLAFNIHFEAKWSQLFVEAFIVLLADKNKKKY